MRPARALLTRILLLAGCARTGPPSAVLAPSNEAAAPWVPDDREMGDLLARCGYNTKDRTTNRHPGWMKDREACLAFVRGAYARKDASTSTGVESIVWLPDAGGVAEHGCAHEGLGEACRWAAYDALTMYDGLTGSRQNADDWREAVRRYLERGCELGDAESCTIRDTGWDSRGRKYPVDVH